MAYQFDLEEGMDAPFSDALSTEIVEFTIGFDLDRDVAVIMSVMLVPVDEAHDLRFGIRERSLSLDWKVSAPDYRISTVRRYIPKRTRSAVLRKLCDAVGVLLKAVQPASVTMETYYPQLTTEALSKYGLICEVFQAYDYVITDQFSDEETLKNHWLFKKRT